MFRKSAKCCKNMDDDLDALLDDAIDAAVEPGGGWGDPSKVAADVAMGAGSATDEDMYCDGDIDL